MTVHYGGFFEVGGAHSLSSATCQISVLARLVKPFLNQSKKLGYNGKRGCQRFKKKSTQTPPNDDDDETSDGETSDGESSKDKHDLLKPVNGERAVGDLLSTIASWQDEQALVN